MRLSDLIGSAGGLLRSANPDSGDLTHYASGAEAPGAPQVTGDQKIDLAAALRHEPAGDVPLRDGDVLTVPQQRGWKDVGATVSLSGEVAKPGVYGIQPGERLSSLLRRAGGLSPAAFPQAAVFERVGVREMQQQSRQDLIQRLEQESITVKTSLTTTGTDESALQQAATQQRQRVLDALRKAPVSGRLVVHVRQGQKDFQNSAEDIELRGGDTLQIPKQPGFVLIVGQVYNSNAITYTPKKNARWYLLRAGGATQLANQRAIFIVRADGAVTSGHGEMWSGGALSAVVGPGRHHRGTGKNSAWRQRLEKPRRHCADRTSGGARRSRRGTLSAARANGTVVNFGNPPRRADLPALQTRESRLLSASGDGILPSGFAEGGPHP